MHEARFKFYDNVAMCDEELMEEFLISDQIEVCHIRDKLCSEKIFPCLFWFCIETRRGGRASGSFRLFYEGKRLSEKIWR